MKRIILLELILLFLATTFMTDGTPGWYQQTLPVNKHINDIFFLDSLTGWSVTAGATSGTDTGYVMKTTNGGTNWLIQYSPIMNFNVIQFLDNNTGYTAGGNGLAKFFKTTNGGLNWVINNTFGFVTVQDLFFVNSDTGWISDPTGFGGVFKTTNGGVSWQQQMAANTFPNKLFFINKDTGWAGSNEPNGKLFKTTNGGINWNLQITFTQQINDIYFFNKLVGIISSGFSYRTTDGGFNWALTNDGGIEVSFANDSIGWAGSTFNKVMKTTTGGRSWFRQTSPIFDNPSSFAIDTLKAWAGGTGLIRTTDGGGPPVGIQQIIGKIPTSFKLYQNYPNPFNPVTNIKYLIKTNGKSDKAQVKIIVYNITGKEVTVLVNQQQSAGTYKVDFDGTNLPSGIYFYQLIISSGQSPELYKETKKMILVK